MLDNSPLRFQFHRQKTLTIGFLEICDKTLATWRRDSNLELSTHLYYLDNGNRIECNTHAISLIDQSESNSLEVEQHVSEANHKVYSVSVSSEKNLGNLLFQVELDMSQIQPVYQATDFELEVHIDCGGTTKQQGLTFCLHENQEDSFLVIENELAKEGEAKSLYQDNKEVQKIRQQAAPQEIALPILEQPFIHQSEGRSCLIELKLFNSALHADEGNNSPSKAIKITRIEAKVQSNEVDAQGLVELDLENHNGLAQSLDNGNPILLRPRSDHDYTRLKVYLKYADHKTCFRNRKLTCDLIISYHPAESSLDLSEDTDSQSVVTFVQEFYTQPDLSQQVVAFDFGTSALAAAHIEDSHGDIINLNKIYAKYSPNKFVKYNPKQTVAAQRVRGKNKSKEITPLISNACYRISRREETAAKIGYELESILSTGSDYFFEKVNLLKSRISACQVDYQFAHGKEKVSTVLKGFYQALHTDYLLKHRNGKDYDRMVVTHPNSYVSGQIEFLKEHIKDQLDCITDVQTLSESDAVINYYLTECLDSHQSSRQHENILCYDMGAGTLDMSFRRLEFDIDGDYRFLRKGQSTLLGMLSVAGAGDELDQVIAQAIDAKLNLIVEYHDAGELSKSGSGFNRFRLTTVDSNADKSQREMDLKIINIVSDAIKEAKIKYSKSADGSDKLIISIATEVESKFIFDFSDEFLSYLNGSDFCDKNNLKITQEEITFYFDPTDIQGILSGAGGYLDKHVDQPFSFCMNNSDSETLPIDIAIISGRGAIFPDLFRAIKKSILENNADAIIFSMESKPSKMKTMVVEGALAWGKQAKMDERLFNTPLLHGVIGVALLGINNVWTWEPLKEGAKFDLDINHREPVVTRYFNPKMYKKGLVVQSSILDPVLALSQLNDSINVDHKISMEIGRSDFFQLLYEFDNINGKWGNFDSIAFSIKPLFSDDPSGSYGDSSQDGYQNLRLRISVTRPGQSSDKDISVWEPERIDIAANKEVIVKKYWPYSVMDD